MSIQATVDIETNDLILTVDADGLKEVVRLLARPADGPIATAPGGQYPMTRPIKRLRLHTDSDDLVEMRTGRDAASISGSPAALARLAEEISSFAEYNDLYEPGMHAHFDPDDGTSSTKALRSGSQSLVIAGPVPDEPAER
jgi:hypothetical protein